MAHVLPDHLLREILCEWVSNVRDWSALDVAWTSKADRAILMQAFASLQIEKSQSDLSGNDVISDFDCYMTYLSWLHTRQLRVRLLTIPPAIIPQVVSSFPSVFFQTIEHIIFYERHPSKLSPHHLCRLLYLAPAVQELDCSNWDSIQGHHYKVIAASGLSFTSLSLYVSHCGAVSDSIIIALLANSRSTLRSLSYRGLSNSTLDYIASHLNLTTFEFSALETLAHDYFLKLCTQSPGLQRLALLPLISELEVVDGIKDESLTAMIEAEHQLVDVKVSHLHSISIRSTLPPVIHKALAVQDHRPCNSTLYALEFREHAVQFLQDEWGNCLCDVLVSSDNFGHGRDCDDLNFILESVPFAFRAIGDHVSGALMIDDAGIDILVQRVGRMSPLMRSTALQELWIAPTAEVTTKSLMALLKAAGPSLISLGLIECSQLTEELVKCIPIFCPRLISLELVDTKHCLKTGNAIQEMLRSFAKTNHQLTSLGIGGRWMDDSLFTMVAETFPDLEGLHVVTRRSFGRVFPFCQPSVSKQCIESNWMRGHLVRTQLMIDGFLPSFSTTSLSTWQSTSSKVSLPKQPTRWETLVSAPLLAMASFVSSLKVV